jgi:acyl transferase domain-containing protein
VDAFYHPDAAHPGTAATRFGGFLAGVDAFDAAFFSISPREASRMDPQQRLLLEVAWEALEHAGIAPDSLRGTPTGVFVGISTSDYSLRQLSDPSLIDAYAGTGNAHSVAANRISYLLDLRGPSLAVDTACSSSLVAVHLACQSLRLGECRVALAAGVNLLLSPQLTIAFSKAEMMAPDGRCKTFDASADGYVRGEGCGVVVLKRLGDAIAEGNRVLAVVRGSAVNQDGLSNGLTAPNAQAQRAVIQEALARAGVAPDTVSCVEAHGTGTPLGDPIEVDALRAALMPGRTPDRPCALASVKTNIGHLEAAAGIAGIIKTVLGLERGQIPPHLHLRTLNPRVALEGTSFFIPSELTPWPATSGPRRAGVSSFGFGGTNAHVILEEAPPSVEPRRDGAARTDLLVLSARTETALRTLSSRCARQLEAISPAHLADACATLRRGRSHLGHRLAVTGASPQELGASLSAFATGSPAPQLVDGRAPKTPPRIAFLFTGQGSQYAGMGRELYDTEPVFRRALDRCETLLRPHLDAPLLSVLWPDAGARPLLDETEYTQPALFALEYALSELWRSFGVEPHAVMGHSVGEISAACSAGVLALDDALPLVALRGRLMQGLPRVGAMAAVLAAEPGVAAAIAPHAADVTIAAVNGPAETVISGRAAAVERVTEALRARGIKAVRLTVSHAFHSPLMDSILDDLESAAARVAFMPARIPLVSNVTGAVARPELVSRAEYWPMHAREPVRFAAGMQALRALGCEAFVEIGPGATLIALGQRCIPAGSATWAPSLRKGRGDRMQLLGAVGALYARGVHIRWEGLDAERAPRPISLPTYPFERQRYWFDLGAAGGAVPADRPAGREREAQPAERLYGVTWRPAPGAGGPAEETGRWIVLADAGGVGDALAAELRGRGGAAETFHAGTPLEDVAGAAKGCRGVVHLWSLDAAADASATDGALMEAQALGCGSALSLARALLAVSPPPRLWFVTRRTQPVTADCAVDPTHAPMWGFGRVLALEHPDLWGGIVDLGAEAPDGAAAALRDEILGSDGEDQIAYRGGRRHVARLQHREDPPASAWVVRPDATYLVTGGLGGIGLALARWLSEWGARHLVLTGRSADAPSPDQLRRVAEIEARGTEVRLVRANAADAAAMAGLLDELRSGAPPLRGVLHAAGIATAAAIELLDASRLRETLAPKLAGAWALHRLTRDLELDLFVCFSSISSILGSRHLGAYAAANAFLDALAHHRAALGLPATTVNWGPWAEVGMAASRNEELARIGMSALRAEDALEILRQLVASRAPQTMVAQLDWSKLLPALEARAPRPLLSEMRPRAADFAEPSALRRRIESAAPPHREALLVAWLRGEVARLVGNGMPEAVDPSQGFFEMGFDSLMGVELKRRIEAALGLGLARTITFEHPNVAALARHLASATGSTPPPARRTSPPGRPHRRRGADPTDGTARGAAPEPLSDDEAEALLLKELESMELERTP